MKAKLVGDRVYFDCPACGTMHAVTIDDKARPQPVWTWNQSLDKPTFTPSILVKHYIGDQIKLICHSFVTDGKIQYLNDCTHELAGQTVELPDFD